MTIVEFHSRVDNGSSVDVAVKSKSSWGKQTTHVSGTLSLPGVGVAYDKNLGYVPSGNYFYDFDTSDRPGFYADPVVMSSN